MVELVNPSGETVFPVHQLPPRLLFVATGLLAWISRAWEYLVGCRRAGDEINECIQEGCGARRERGALEASQVTVDGSWSFNVEEISSCY